MFDLSKTFSGIDLDPNAFNDWVSHCMTTIEQMMANGELNDFQVKELPDESFHVDDVTGDLKIYIPIAPLNKEISMYVDRSKWNPKGNQDVSTG